jgi:hypothetical protein
MALENSKALRDAIQNDPALTAFWLARYGKAATHKIGYKRSANASDFPSVSLVPVGGKRGGKVLDEEIVSVVVGVNDPGLTDGVSDGFAHLDEAITLIVHAIERLIAEDVRLVWDLGEHHPFYEAELAVRVKSRVGKPGHIMNRV